MFAESRVQSKRHQLITSALSHPLISRIRPSLRRGLWALRSLATRNPQIPERVESMLFVCLGNICRSPFGAELAKRLLAEGGNDHIRCTSAGLRPSQAGRSPQEACRASTVYGVSLDQHVPQALTRDLMHSHDMVLVMEWRHFRELHGAYPKSRDRIFLLPLFDEVAGSAYERVNITDPFNRPLAAYEECYTRIDRALRRCLARIDRS